VTLSPSASSAPFESLTLMSMWWCFPWWECGRLPRRPGS